MAVVTPKSPSPNSGRGGGEEVPDHVSGRALAVFDYATSAAFIYFANPRFYDVFDVGDGTYEILPALRQLHLEAGVGGVRETEETLEDGTTRRGVDPSNAIKRAIDQGWIEVPKSWEVTAFGDTFPNYIHSYRVRRGTAFLPRWVRLYSLGGQVDTERDPAGFAAFQRKVAKDLLPVLDTNIRKGLESRLRTMLVALKRRNPGTPEAGSAAATVTDKLASLKPAAKPLQAAAAPAGA